MKKLIFLIAVFMLTACNSLQQAPEPNNAGLKMPQSLLSVVDPALIETRYCGAPKRDINGTIIRRTDVVKAYWAQHVCPTTGLYKAPCPDHALNHIFPLACGGCDAVNNMMAMRVDAKKIVDSYERKISAANPPYPDTAACPPLVTPLPRLVVTP